MANNQTPKLRAFIRIDGSGRVIPGAPIFQANKPKVGTWREIPLYYRGVPTSSTTTSTTTVTPSTTTTTTAAPVYTFSNISGSSNGFTACNGFDAIFTAYSNSISIATGTILYTDSSLTTPVNPSTLAGFTGYPYSIVQGGIGSPRFAINSSGVVGVQLGTC